MTETSPKTGLAVRRVLIVTKKTTYQLDVLEKQDARLLRLIAEGNEATLKLERTHNEHLASLDVVKAELTRLAIEHKVIDRSEIEAEKGEYDLVISFGGDGTFLETSHYVGKTPIIGFNSATFSSHGHWCMANKDNFASVIADVLSGAVQPLAVMRLQVLVNGVPLKTPVINEVLICHPSPAGTSRYALTVDGKHEEQRSSGILVGAGAGSTGFMRSAGGKILPVGSTQFQLIVRDPCIWPGEKVELRNALVERGNELKLVAIMPEGKVFIDGQHNSHDFVRGDEVVVRAHPDDLSTFVRADVNDGY